MNDFKIHAKPMLALQMVQAVLRHFYGGFNVILDEVNMDDRQDERSGGQEYTQVDGSFGNKTFSAKCAFKQDEGEWYPFHIVITVKSVNNTVQPPSDEGDAGEEDYDEDFDCRFDFPNGIDVSPVIRIEV